MPTGKNAVLQTRTGEMQFAMARVIAECHADGMRDGLNHAGEIVAQLYNNMRSAGADADVLSVVDQIGDLLKTAAFEVSAHEPNPADFGVGTISREVMKDQIRRFIDGE